MIKTSTIGLITDWVAWEERDFAGLSDRRITHGNHPRSTRLWRIFQCLAVPRQPLKLLETLEIRVLKRLASAVQLRPWPPSFQRT